MIFLRTGLPGASKTLNSFSDLVTQNDGTRPIYYHNVRLVMLDYDVASSFSGWFYGSYLHKLKNKGAIKRLQKIIKRVHADEDYVSLEHVPWLQSYFEASSPLETWLAWVRKLYSKKQLEPMEEFISNMPAEQLTFDSLKQFNLHFTYFENARDWFKLPKTSIIFIDECQQFFPPRAIGSKVPDHVSEFETHRHKGFDIHLVTQDRMLLDNHVRKLTNKHIHYHNPFGGERVSRYENSKVFDPDNYFDTQACQKSIIKRPSIFYGSYFSSEMHTHKFKMPKIFIVGVFLLIFFILIIYLFFTSDLMSPKKTTNDSVTKVSETDSKVSKVAKINNLNQNDSPMFRDYVAKLTDGVFITGSLYKRDSKGLVSFDYSFAKKDTSELFEPSAVGFSVNAISPCLVRLSFDNYTTFITCDPFSKYEDLSSQPPASSSS